GGAGGEMGAQDLGLGLVEQAVQVVEQQVAAIVTGQHGVSGSFSTRRSFCKAARIWVLTVPTGRRRISAISSQVKSPFWRSRKTVFSSGRRSLSASRRRSRRSFSSRVSAGEASTISPPHGAVPSGLARRRQALRCRSLAALRPTRKIQARMLCTSDSEARVRQHFRNASWAASWASSWLPSRKYSVLTNSLRTSLKARTKSSAEVVAPCKVRARAEVLTASSLIPSPP